MGVLLPSRTGGADGSLKFLESVANDQKRNFSHRDPFQSVPRPHSTGSSPCVPPEVQIVGFYPPKLTEPTDYASVVRKRGSTVDPALAGVLAKHGVEPSPDFLWTEKTQRGVFNGLRKRANASYVDAFKGDSDLLRIAVQMVIDTMPRGAILQPSQFEITATGASGVGYECCKDKGSVFLNHGLDLEHYLANYRSLPRPLAKYMHKVEILPKKKSANDLTRSIIYFPTHFYALQLMHTQAQDAALKSGSHPFVAVGKSLFGGNMNRLAQAIKQFLYKLKGDITGFDASMRRFIMSLICEVRKATCDPASADALDFIYDVLSDHEVVLPDGTVVKDFAQTSGQACTTTDDTIAHLIVIFYMILCRLRANNLPLDLRTVYQYAFFSIYADDHVAATNDATLASFAYRASQYALFGLTLKPEDDLVTESVEELTFLGGYFRLVNGKYVYHYASDELEGAWLIGSSGRKPLETANAMLSTILLRGSDPGHHSRWSSIYSAYCALYPSTKFPFRGVAPSLSYYRSFLSGYEVHSSCCAASD